MNVPRRSSVGLLCLILLATNGCPITDAIDNAIDQIQQTQQAIVAQSDAWRAALPKLVDQISQLESQASSDVKGIIGDTRNQVQDLAKDTIQFASINAQEILAKTGVEYRCDANFTMDGVKARLQYLIDDLKFWKANKRHSDNKPVHAVCQVLSEYLTLYPQTNGNFGIDSNKLVAPNIVEVYGYNFSGDALPSLNLVGANGSVLRAVNVKPAYVTQYQLSIDFSTETFAGVSAGSRVIFNWPDQTEPTTISLTLAIPAKLKIVNTVFTPSSPIATKDQVTLAVTVTNTGNEPSGAFTLNWTPQGGRVQSINELPIQPGVSRTLVFPGYTYPAAGNNTNTIALSNGDDVQSPGIVVQSNILNVHDYANPRPVINRAWSSTGIQVAPGDKVEIIAGGGCVNTGGSGKSTKRYIDPLDEGNSCRLNRRMYFGTIAIPGTIEEAARKMLSDFWLSDKFAIVNRAATIELGYVDDSYGDNSYNSFDVGTCDQCAGYPPAYVTIRVTKFK